MSKMRLIIYRSKFVDQTKEAKKILLGVVSEMVKAAGEAGDVMITD